MKVNSTSSNPLLNGVSGGTRNETTAQAPASAAASGRTAVDLSPAARHLAALNDNNDDVRAERIQQIRDALASGELKIDASRIAVGLLASVRDLLK